MIKITVLGSGASVPSVQRNLPGLAVKFGNVFLFDCGEGSQRQMMKYAVGYGSVKAIFITHMHLDHYLGIFGLLSTLKLMGRKEELYIFGPQGIENLGIDYPFVKVVQVTRQNAGRLYEEKGFSISAFPTLHSAKSFGFAFCLDDKWLFDEKKAKGMG
ncbi:MBL fold metallo-hydrolase, partial [Candidatus Parvarchaeota archaeon]|nr:MBL fold metallo-hydrolase [Candidatus Parvarchaeota archaeon]